MKKFNKNNLGPLFLLGLILFGFLSIFFDEEYKKHDDEPVKNQIFNVQLSSNISASTATGGTAGTISPSPEA